MKEDIVLQIEGFLDKIFSKKESTKESAGYKKMMTAAAMLRDELSHIESTEELQQFKEDDLEDFKDDWITHGPEDVVPQAQVQYDRLISIVNKKFKKVD